MFPPIFIIDSFSISAELVSVSFRLLLDSESSSELRRLYKSSNIFFNTNCAA